MRAGSDRAAQSNFEVCCCLRCMQSQQRSNWGRGCLVGQYLAWMKPMNGLTLWCKRALSFCTRACAFVTCMSEGVL